MKRTGFLGGAIAVLLVLALVGAYSLPAGARPDPTPPSGTPEGPPPEGPPPVGPGGPLMARDFRPQAPVRPEPSALSIDDLLAKLDVIKAQKAALEKSERETVALLKERLEQQRLRLQKLGVTAEEGVAPQPPARPVVGLEGSTPAGPRPPIGPPHRPEN